MSPRGDGPGSGGVGGRLPGRGRVVQATLLAGAVAGAAAVVFGRRLEESARRGLVDWPTVEAVAARRLRSAPGALSRAELRASEPLYAEALDRVVPRLESFLDSPLPGVVERREVVDRATWVEINIATFEGIVDRIEGSLLEQLLPPGVSPARSSIAIANRWLTTRQLGYLLGYLGQRVLGQYDLTLLAAESSPGRLLFLEENIRRTARVLDVPVDPFRTWITLHETTHAFEFEANTWLRPYLAERLEAQLAAFSRDVSVLSRDALRSFGRAARGGEPGSHWMERLMTPEQRRLFRETQTVMSVLEGFGDYVMDELGEELVPGSRRISRRFHARRARRSGLDRAIMRLTGLDLKMEQYRRGEQFVAAVARAGGREALGRLWTGPAALPTPEELSQPSHWLARMGI